MNTPNWVKDAVFYQIFPDRFFNGDRTNDPPNVVGWDEKPTPYNFFGGDLAGIIEKLDYLEELGINALYLNPIFKAPSNHKYDTEDYYRVDPHFGDNETLKELVFEAHKRDMRIILDGVFNHCGERFFAFQDLLENGERSRYRDWFVVYEFPITTDPEPNYACWAGVPSMPEFNTKNPETREYLLNIVEHWIREADIDGWRLDAVEYLEPSFVVDIRRRAKKVKEDVYIVGEVVGTATSWFKAEALDGVMNYKLWDLIVDFFAKGKHDARWFNSALYFLRRSYPRWANYSNFNLLGSHDRPRFLTICENDVRKLKLALVFLMTYIGAPSIYYGDEIGMEGENDPDCRRTFIWDEKRQNKEILDFFKFVIKLRKEQTTLRRGSFNPFYFEGGIYGYLRKLEGQSIIVVLNNSEREENITIDMDLAGFKPSKVMDLVRGDLIDPNGSTIDVKIPEYGFILLLLQS